MSNLIKTLSEIAPYKLANCHLRAHTVLINEVLRAYKSKECAGTRYPSHIDYLYGISIVTDDTLATNEWKIVTNSSHKVLRQCSNPIEIQESGSYAIDVVCGCSKC